MQLENKVDVVISDQDNTLTLVDQIPGITDESVLWSGPPTQCQIHQFG